MTGGHKRPDLTSASDAKQDRADDPLGAVVPSRAHDNPAPSSTPESDLSNVVTFTPRSRKASERKAPAIEIAAADRPAPQAYSRERQRKIAFLIGGSLLIHGAIFAAFNQEPEPHASIGVISVMAEIVLGAQSNAGRSVAPTESEGIENPYSPTTDRPTDIKPEIARKDIAKQPVDEPKEAKQEKADTAAPKASEPLPAETPPEPTAQAELVVEPKPLEKPTLTPDQKKPEAREAKKVREAARHAKDDGESLRDRAAPAFTPSSSSNSIGRGRSDLDTNYRGIVAAHLARYKQFPADARSGDHGIALVAFEINGNGSVASVRLVRGSGVSSLDQGALAWVRRASPFPAPPSGRTENFTVPLNFTRR